jgi:aspartyl-tRNA(Asn)/glutamyl-tRNA(Gln) amidotransferase subunit B
MRSKEEAHDYRYFPDPDLVPILISNEWIEDVRRTIPELQLEKQDRFVAQYGIPVYDASVLTTTRALADFYEEAVKLCGKPKIAGNWVMGDLLRYLNEQKRDIQSSPVSPAHIAEMINLIEDGTISGKIAKEVFEEMYKSAKRPADIVKEKGLTQITDEGAVVKAVEEAMAKNPAQLAEYRAGKEKLFAFFVGQVMKITRGKANPQLVNDLLKKMLSGS